MTTVHVQTCLVGGGPAGLMNSPLFPRIQRRIFFGVPLPPLDPAFSFRQGSSTLSV